MAPVEELIHTQEYWIDRIQNEIFRLAHNYMKRNKLNQSQLAERLNVSKGYVSQIMNGNFNLSLTKLIDLSLSLEAAPVLEFHNIDDFAKSEVRRLEKMREEEAGVKYTFSWKNAVPTKSQPSMWVSPSLNLPEEVHGTAFRIQKSVIPADSQQMAC